MRNIFLIWASAILSLGLLLPNHYSPWLSFHQEFAAGLAFLPILIWGILRDLRLPLLGGGAVVLALVPLAQWFAGKIYFGGDAWLASLYIVGFGFAVHAGAQCCEKPDRGQASHLSALSPFWIALLFTALASVGIATNQWLISDYQGIYFVEIPPGARPFANLAQPNQLATLLLLGVAAAIFLYESGKTNGLIASAAVATLIWGTVLTASRSVMLALAWMIPMYWLSRRRCRLRLWPSVFFGAIALYLVLLWLLPVFSHWLLISEESSGPIHRMGSVGVREIYWRSMIDAIARAPWSGYGWGQISLAQAATALDYPAVRSNFDSAHNFVLDIALWNGVPIAFGVVVCLTLWVRDAGKACVNPQAWATLLGILIVFSHAMVEYPLAYAYFLLPVGFLMGSMSKRIHSSPAQHGEIFPRFIFSARLGLVIGVGAVFTMVVWEYSRFEADWRLIRYQEARIGDLEKTPPPPAIVLTNLSKFAEFSRIEPRREMSGEELELMRQISVRYTYSSTIYKYALALALNGKTEQAIRTLRILCKIHTRYSCNSAKSHWEVLSKQKFPELVHIPFPIDER